MTTSIDNNQNECQREQNKKKKNIGMFHIFEQAKKLCKKEQHQIGEDKQLTFLKLKQIYLEISHLLNQPYTILSTEFVGALCIFVYITRSSKSFQKTRCPLKKQFYSNLPEVFAESYSSYQKKCQPSCLTQKGTTFSTLLRITLEIHEQNARLRRKIFSDKMIKLIIEMKHPEREDLLRQVAKLKINALYFANLQQRISLNRSLLDIFQSHHCDGLITEKILRTVQNVTPINQLPKEQIKKLINFLKYKILNSEERYNQYRPMAWFYIKYIYLCEEESFLAKDFKKILHKFQASVGVQKNLLKHILENLTFEQTTDHIMLVQNFLSAKGMENQCYAKLLIKNFPNFNSGTLISILNMGILEKLDSLIGNSSDSQLNKSLSMDLYQKMKECFGELNQALRWTLQNNLKMYSFPHKNNTEYPTMENLKQYSLK